MIEAIVADVVQPPDDDSAQRRWRRLGVDTLSDVELLSLAVGSVSIGGGPSRHAQLTLESVGGVRGLARAGMAELAARLGHHRARRLAAAFELARRSFAERLDPTAPWTSSRDVVRAYGPRLRDHTEETVFAIVLDARNRPIAERKLAVGGAAHCTVSPRAIFALAVREGGAGVILVHNHPSGDPSPSHEDIVLTNFLADAGRALEVPLIDHVVVAAGGSFSFLDAGMLATPVRFDAAEVTK